MAMKKIRVCINIWEYVVCLHCIYTVGHACIMYPENKNATYKSKIVY